MGGLLQRRRRAASRLRVGLELQVAHLDSAGLQLIACDTLGEALQELAEVAPAIGEGGGFELECGGAIVHLVYRPHLAVRASERVEAVLASVLSLARWATGGRFAAAGLWFSHAPLAPAAAYAALLDVPVAFGAARDSLGFDAAHLALPLLGANAELREHLRARTAHLLAGLGRSSLATAVQRQMHANPAWGRERVAAALALSGRHMVRRLAEEGLSFKTLRQGLLDDMACARCLGRGAWSTRRRSGFLPTKVASCAPFAAARQRRRHAGDADAGPPAVRPRQRSAA